MGSRYHGEHTRPPATWPELIQAGRSCVSLHCCRSAEQTGRSASRIPIWILAALDWSPRKISRKCYTSRRVYRTTMSASSWRPHRRKVDLLDTTRSLWIFSTSTSLQTRRSEFSDQQAHTLHKKS